jgi:hypothetical protein
LVFGGPFRGVPARRRRQATWALAPALLIQLRLFAALERRMRATGGPGIIPFELAGTPERTRRIIDVWGPDGRRAARQSLLLDYAFPPTYACLQALGCMATGDRYRAGGRSVLAAAGGPLAWGQLAAAGFDYVENTALLLTLAGRDSRAPALARRAALAKFALLFAGWSYMLFGVTVRR